MKINNPKILIPFLDRIENTLKILKIYLDIVCKYKKDLN
jgi:hypothetical protein